MCSSFTALVDVYEFLLGSRSQCSQPGCPKGVTSRGAATTQGSDPSLQLLLPSTCKLNKTGSTAQKPYPDADSGSFCADAGKGAKQRQQPSQKTTRTALGHR
jgi:hypothetical protein